MTNKKFKYTLKQVIDIMKSVAKTEKMNLVFLDKNSGLGGYNYGASAGKDNHAFAIRQGECWRQGEWL